MSENRINVWVQKFKDRANLVLQWIDPDTGKRKSKSSRTNDPDKAEKARADLEYELSHGQFEEASKLTWKQLRALFEDEHLSGLRERSREKYKTVLDVFEEIVQPAQLRTINERSVSKFVRGMRERPVPGGKIGLAPQTIKNYLVALSTTLKWAVGQKLLPRVPHFPRIKVPRKKPQPVSQQDFDKLLEVAPDRMWRAFLLCGWWAGLRLSEARALRRAPTPKWPWVDFERNRIVLPAEFVKSAEDQWIPMHANLREALSNVLVSGNEFFPFKSSRNDQPLSRSSISSSVINLAKKAKVELSMHMLRKGFGCRVAKQLGKGRAPVLHRLMRHSSMQITMD